MKVSKTIGKKLIAILKNQSPEQGFSLVVATGFGLVIMMIGLTIVGRAIKDSSVSASQKTISRSFAAAESGVTQYLSFINRNRWVANSPDSGTTTSWANPAEIRTLYNTGTITTIQAASQKTWRDLDPGNATKGQYRLISYQPPISGGTQGILTVEGRVNQSGTAITDPDDIRVGKTRLQVVISVNPFNISDLPFSGIWLNDGTGTIGQIFKANGRLSSTRPTNLDLYTWPEYVSNQQRGIGNQAPLTSLRISDFLPPKPTPFLNSDLTARLNSGDVTLPDRVKDIPDTEIIDGVQMKVYRYPAGDLTSKYNLVVNSINSAPTGTELPEKVIIYLDGNIDLKGNAEIKHNCTDRNGITANSCDLNNFQIYGYNPANQPRKICTQGAFSIQSFIIAPTYTAGINASGSGQGGFKGAVWVNNWGRPCNNLTSNQLAVTQSGNWGQVLPFLTQPPEFPPKISVISSQVVSIN